MNREVNDAIAVQERLWRGRFSAVTAFLFYVTIWLSFTLIILALSASLAVIIFRGLTHS